MTEETLIENPEMLEGPQAPRKSWFHERVQQFNQNRMAIVGLVIFLVFFITAVAGVI
ncbi:MAG TPA: ABC transporter permease, partial [Desulfobacteria bacterium]|nr:ABC transporter permease [Desulfobacteria bacterium]